MRKTTCLLAFFIVLADGPFQQAFARQFEETRDPSGLFEEADAERSSEYSTAVSDTEWHFMPSVFGGYNQLLKGYAGYKNLGNVGADVWIYPVTLAMDEDHWHTNAFLMRISAEWMPLQVPKGNYGLVEDLYALTGQIVYKFNRERKGSWLPFIGIGAGDYMDRTTLDTPATGKITGTNSYFGVNASLGMFLPVMGPFRASLEARYHKLRGPDGFWPQNVTYHMGLTYGFRAAIE